MTINHYFQSGTTIGRNSEQLLHEDLIIECLKIYGFEVFYMPRSSVSLDTILNEDPLNKYTQAYPLEMYLSDINGFQGEGDLLTKFGVEIRDQANFTVSKRRWDQTVARAGSVQLDTRPAEGDLLFFPLTKSFFEIRRVEGTDPFFQLGKLYVYNLFCELFQYSSEDVDTHRPDIDDIERIDSLDVKDFDVLLENDSRLLLEYTANSSIILESFKIENIDGAAQNDSFDLAADGVLDFSEKNPFGEYR
tara:strand:- start:348 stop:1091 length:744 start_codon:yes stop_codon:yes gene_type:complete